MRHNFFLIFLFVCFNILGQVEVIGPNDITICPDGDLNDISIIQLKEETANGFGGAGSFRSFTISLNENDFSFHQFGDVDVYSIQDSSFSNLQATFDNAQTLRVSYTVNGGSDGNADEISTIFISGLQVETSNVEDSGAEIRIQGADIGFGTAEKIADVSVLNYTPTLAASVPSFCAGNGNGVNLSIEKPTGDGFEYTIERKLSSQTDWSYTALTSAGNTQPSYWDVVTTAETYNYRAKIDGPSYCQVTSAYSNVVTVTVNRAQNVSFAETPSNITTQTPAFDLNDAFEPSVSGGDWSGPGVLGDDQTFSPAIFTNQGNQSNLRLQYTYTSNGCTRTVNATAFDVSDIPEYVSPVSSTQSLPLCEVNTQIPFKIVANKKIEDVIDNSSAISNISGLDTKDVRLDINPYYESGGVVTVSFKFEGESSYRQESIPVQRAYLAVNGINSYYTYCDTASIEMEVEDGITGNFRYSMYPYYNPGGYDHTYRDIDSLDKNNANKDTLSLAGLPDGRYRMEFEPSTTSGGCNLSTVTRYFYLQQTPKSEMEIKGLLQGALLCDEDTIVFRDTVKSSRLWNNYSSSHTIDSLYKRYRWEFGDGSSTPLTPHDTLKKHKFLSPGKYTAKLFVEETLLYKYLYRGTEYEYTRAMPCATTYTYDFTVGATPQADFVIEDYYINPLGTHFSDSTQMNYSETNKDDVQVEWRWDFGDANTSIDEHPTHVYTTEGLYDVKLATVGFEGCADSITKPVPVFPQHLIDKDNSKTFTFLNAANNEGWFSTTDFESGENSSWRITSPNGTLIQGIDGSAWMTSNPNGPYSNKHSVNENSWVLSPMFDVSGMTRPMVSMNYWVNAENRVDGATIQYTVSDTTFGNEQWITLGEFGQGGDWFNNEIITSNPGNTTAAIKNGWTGVMENWLLGRTAIDEAVDSAKAVNSGRIQFRVAFASNENPPEDFDGFAFDNFFIGERSRQVLIENFTTTTSSIVKDQNNLITSSIGRSNDEAILINYHLQTDYPNTNYFFQYNPADPGARALYYGIGFNDPNNISNEAPRSMIDGYYFEDKPFAQDQWGETAYSLRILDPTSFEVTSPVITSVNGNSITFSTDVTRSNVIASEGPFVVRMVVVKDSASNRLVTDGVYYDNVVVQVLPSSAGLWYPETWNPTTAETISMEWQLFETPIADETYQVLAFIQDASTGEVYQTSTLTDIDLSDLPNVQSPVYGPDQLAKYSAPLSMRVQQSTGAITPVHLSFAPGAGQQWKLYDLLGKEVAGGTLKEAQQIINIENGPLSSGIYLVKVEGHEAVGKIRVVK